MAKTMTIATADEKERIFIYTKRGVAMLL